MSADLKTKLADYLIAGLDDDGVRGMIRDQLGADRVEVDVLGPLQAQVKVWPGSGGAPRYFMLRLSEAM